MKCKKAGRASVSAFHLGLFGQQDRTQIPPSSKGSRGAEDAAGRGRLDAVPVRDPDAVRLERGHFKTAVR